MVYLGLPINSMVDLSMANCECHNQMVTILMLVIGWLPSGNLT